MLKRVTNGLHKQLTCVHPLKAFTLYSTSAASKGAITNPLIVKYLVKSLGFSEQEAASIVSKIRYPLYIKRSDSVVDFLRKSGFDATQIRSVVAGYPDVLRNDVEKTLNPKLRAFQEIGFSGSNLGLIISRHPNVLGRSLKSHIVPALGMLNSVIGTREQLVKVMLQIRTHRLLSHHVLKTFPANVLLLQRYGVTTPRIRWLLLQRGFVFANTQWVQKIVKGVEEKLGIPRTSAMFVYGISVLTKKSEAKFESWRDIFRSYGWSEDEIWRLLRSHPLSLSLSEKNLRARLKYLMEELGYESDYLAGHAALLSYSMEKRIVPRVAVIQTLKENDMLKRRVAVYSVLLLSELEFRKKYVLPYKEELPQLLESYTRAMSCSPSKT